MTQPNPLALLLHEYGFRFLSGEVPPMPNNQTTAATTLQLVAAVPATAAPTAPPPSRVVGGEAVQAFVVTGGAIAIQETRPDGTPGKMVVIPEDEWDERYISWWARVCARSRGRHRLRLMR